MFPFRRVYPKFLKSRLSSFFPAAFLCLLLTSLVLFSTNTAHGYDPSFEWDANTEPDLAGYRVYHREQGQDYDFDTPSWEGVETSCTIYGLDDHTIYYFVSKAYDIYGNESENSAELSNDPTYGTSAADDGGGGCFIATAAFGSIIDPHVKLLRQFRDRFLSNNFAGKILTQIYYTYSPPIADVISAHDSLKIIVRWGLFPIIGLSWMLLNLGAGLKLLVLSLTGSAVWKSFKKFERYRATTRE